VTGTTSGYRIKFTGGNIWDFCRNRRLRKEGRTGKFEHIVPPNHRAKRYARVIVCFVPRETERIRAGVAVFLRPRSERGRQGDREGRRDAR
jgi:hypothetical protein